MLYSGREVNESTMGHAPRVNNNIGPVTCTTGGKILWVILCILTLGLLCIKYLTTSNRFAKMQMEINETASNIDIQLEKRFDTLTKLVDSVKGHVNFNKEIFTTIAAYRSGMNINEKTDVVNKISSALTMSFENYPNLGADESIRTLNTESIMIEKEIAATRRLYNSTVTRFNSEIYQWPNNVILCKKNYQAVPLFETSLAKRSDVSVKF